MSRYDYDDMPSRDRRRRSKGSRNTALGLIIVILLVLIGIVVAKIALTPVEKPVEDIQFEAPTLAEATTLIDFSAKDEPVEETAPDGPIEVVQELVEVEEEVVQDLPSEVTEMEPLVETEAVPLTLEPEEPVFESEMTEEALDPVVDEAVPMEEVPEEELFSVPEVEEAVMAEETEEIPSAEEVLEVSEEILEVPEEGESLFVSDEVVVGESLLEDEVPVEYSEQDEVQGEDLSEELIEKTKVEEDSEVLPAIIEEEDVPQVEELPVEVVVQEPVVYLVAIDSVIAGGEGSLDDLSLVVKAKSGQAVLSIGAATVSATGRNGKAKYVELILEDGYIVRYEGLETVRVKNGQTIKGKDILGSVGTSSSLGPAVKLSVFGPEGDEIQVSIE